MREIKFRAWDKIKNKMELNVHLSDGNNGSEMYLNNERYEVMQFIVNEDNNDIYEKDIIQAWKHGDLKRTFIAEDIRTFIREYNKDEHSSVYKVIGNIYENPELLK